MEPFTKGEIVLFPFPYTDLKNRKLRPCLVLSEEFGEDILLCQITSNKVARDKYCVLIEPSDTSSGSLYITSYVRCNMLFTCNKSQLLKKVARLKPSLYRKVVQNITNIVSI